LSNNFLTKKLSE